LSHTKKLVNCFY